MTIVELMPRILPTLDADLGSELLKIFKQRGITCHLDTKVEELRIVGAAVTARLSSGEHWQFDRVLVATGRRPNTRRIGPRAGGDSHRSPRLCRSERSAGNERAGHFTIGDANGRSMLAHAASAQGVAAAENALGKRKAVRRRDSVGRVHVSGSRGRGDDRARSTRRGIANRHRPLPDRPFGQGDGGPASRGIREDHSPPRDERIARRSYDRPQCHGMHGRGYGLDSTKGVDARRGRNVWAHPTISESIKEAAEDALGVGLHLPPRKVMRIAAAMA